jgi:hypothetical protein
MRTVAVEADDAYDVTAPPRMFAFHVAPLLGNLLFNVWV